MSQTSSSGQNKRLAKDLQMLKNLDQSFKVGRKDTPLGIILHVSRCNQSQFLDKQCTHLYFDIIIQNNFPMQGPQILCKNKVFIDKQQFSKPTLADGRDVLNEVIHKDWTSSMSIYEVIQLLPDFVSEMLLNTQSENQIKFIGKYHIGMKYDIFSWIQGPNINVFQCKEEKDPTDKSIPDSIAKQRAIKEGISIYQDRYLVLSESSLLLMQPDPSIRSIASLLSWASLYSLDKITRTLDEPNFLTLHWRKINEEQPWVFKVKLEQHAKFIGLIENRLKEFGITNERQTEKKRKILASEVTALAVKDVNINELLDQIGQYEMSIQQQVTKDKVQTLMNLYNKVVEYYSAIGNRNFGEFLERLTKMLAREDVQKCWEEEEVKENGRSDTEE